MKTCKNPGCPKKVFKGALCYDCYLEYHRKQSRKRTLLKRTDQQKLKDFDPTQTLEPLMITNGYTLVVAHVKTKTSAIKWSIIDPGNLDDCSAVYTEEVDNKKIIDFLGKVSKMG